MSLPTEPCPKEESWEETVGDYDEEEFDGEEDDDDAAAEAAAEAMAAQLKDQLWADISRAQAQSAVDLSPCLPLSTTALSTVSLILDLIATDPLASSLIASTALTLPGSGHANVLDALRNSLAVVDISPSLATALAPAISAFARHPSLFSSSPPLPSAKRKRQGEEALPPSERLAFPRSQADLQHRITSAAHSISSSLALLSDATPVIDRRSAPSLSAVISDLADIFAFASTSAVSGQLSSRVLMETSGLARALLVVHGLGFDSHNACSVYRCPLTGCHKPFVSLAFMRSHHDMHSTPRTFACTHPGCSATFARNHDLKRHQKLHERTAWRCVACGKVFSRRDALTRHRNNSARDDAKVACVTAGAEEVEVPGEVTEDAGKDVRRSKPWMVEEEDEGEILAEAMTEMQALVLALHAPLIHALAWTVGTADEDVLAALSSG